MRVQEVMMRALSGELHWFQAAAILRRQREPGVVPEPPRISAEGVHRNCPPAASRLTSRAFIARSTADSGYRQPIKGPNRLWN